MISLGIHWLASKGAISISSHSAEMFTLELSGVADPIAQRELEQSLGRVFVELQAFTDHLRQSDLASLTEELR